MAGRLFRFFPRHKSGMLSVYNPIAAGGKRNMLKHLLTITAAAVLLITAAALAEASSESPLDIKNIGVEYTEEFLLFPRKPTARDIEARQRAFFIGSRNGSGITLSQSETEVSQSGPTRWFSIPASSEVYGFRVASRFAAVPRASFSLEWQKKDIDAIHFTDTHFVTSVPAGIQWICSPATPCVDIYDWAAVESNPIIFNASWNPAPEWNLALGWSTEKLKLDTPTGSTEKVRAVTLGASHSWEKASAGILLEKINPARAPDNTHLQLSASWKFLRDSAFSLKVGRYSSGVPLTGGALSDMGDQFVFEYLSGDDKISPLYTNDIGYIMLGVTLGWYSR